MQVSARLIFAYILFNICTRTSAEYYISKNNKLSYLHHKFEQIEEEIFPADIRIKFSLSQLVGTLLYSIDRNMNQLIINLHDSTPPTLIIEFNTQKTFISISKLCSCEWCRYETLDLRLRIAEREVHLRCNGGDTQTLNLGKTKELNKDYPIMYNATDDSTTSMNEAHIWLVNTPPIGESTPNHYQTHGCIFEVAYKRRPISFKDVTHNIKRSCKRTCIDNICNGGQCLETYNDYRVCNCTTTFLNGRYCNDSIKPKNLKTKSSLYVFDMIKISWKSSGEEIMGLYNTKLNIRLLYQNNELFVYYSYQNGMKFTSKAIIFENYVPNKESICIFYFHTNSIDIWTFNNGSWSKTAILSYTEIKQEIFNTITLRSCDGVIDFRYKYAHEYDWRSILISEHDNLTCDNQQMKTTAVSLLANRSKRTTTNRQPIKTFTVFLSINQRNKTTIDTSHSKVIVISISVALGAMLALLISITAIYLTRRYREKNRAFILMAGNSLRKNSMCTMSIVSSGKKEIVFLLEQETDDGGLTKKEFTTTLPKQSISDFSYQETISDAGYSGTISDGSDMRTIFNDSYSRTISDAGYSGTISDDSDTITMLNDSYNGTISDVFRDIGTTSDNSNEETISNLRFTIATNSDYSRDV